MHLLQVTFDLTFILPSAVCFHYISQRIHEHDRAISSGLLRVISVSGTKNRNSMIFFYNRRGPSCMQVSREHKRDVFSAPIRKKAPRHIKLRQLL